MWGTHNGIGWRYPVFCKFMDMRRVKSGDSVVRTPRHACMGGKNESSSDDPRVTAHYAILDRSAKKRARGEVQGPRTKRSPDTARRGNGSYQTLSTNLLPDSPRSSMSHKGGSCSITACHLAATAWESPDVAHLTAGWETPDVAGLGNFDRWAELGEGGRTLRRSLC